MRTDIKDLSSVISILENARNLLITEIKLALQAVALKYVFDTEDDDFDALLESEGIIEVGAADAFGKNVSASFLRTAENPFNGTLYPEEVVIDRFVIHSDKSVSAVCVPEGVDEYEFNRIPLEDLPTDTLADIGKVLLKREL